MLPPAPGKKIYEVTRRAPSDPASAEPFQDLVDLIRTAGR
jgi:hypothetical protein